MNRYKQDGFIALFLILTISFGFVFYIYLSSEKVFEYIHIKNDFIKNRLFIQDIYTCSDIFVNNFIKSDLNLDIKNNEYSFYRNFYFDDPKICNIYSINISYFSDDIYQINFIIENISLKYIYKKGFLEFKKPWELF